MSSSKGLLRHLAQQQRLWSCCSPLSVITRQTTASAASVSAPLGIFNGYGIGIGSARGLTSLINGGQTKPSNARRDNGRPVMPIGIRRYVSPMDPLLCTFLLQIECPSHQNRWDGRWMMDWAHTPPTAGSFAFSHPTVTHHHAVV